MTAMVSDLSYSDYMTRQFRELEPEQLLERATALRPSGNYRRNGHGWVPQSYPGFAVLSMVEDNAGNNGLVSLLKAIQADLLEHCPWEEALYPLPAGSFHQTVANTLSAERFEQHIVRAGLEPAYPDIVANTFARMPVLPSRVLPMRLIGLAIFGTCMGVLGVFDDEAYYRRILEFRDVFYADAGLRALDVRRTRPFIGHITLAYIEAELSPEQRETLVEGVVAINRSLPEAAPTFNLALTGLRRYHHLSAFHREDDYPRYHL